MELRSYLNSDEDYLRPNTTRGRNSSQNNEPKSARIKTAVSLNPENVHESLIKTFEQFYTQESQSMIEAIEKSRAEMRESVKEFFEEQLMFKEQLAKVSEGRYAFRRRKENAIPLAEYIRKKKELIDPEYAASTSTPTIEGQHPSDREAVEKYLRKRERRKVAEKNQQNRQINEEELEKESKKIIENLQGLDVKSDKERDRQAEILKLKLEEKKNRKDATQIASDLIDKYQDSQLAQETERLAQKEKLEARLSAVRSLRSATVLSAETKKSAIADIDI